MNLRVPTRARRPCQFVGMCPGFAENCCRLQTSTRTGLASFPTDIPSRITHHTLAPRFQPPATGVFALIIAGERLTNVLGSFARSTPRSPLYESSADETSQHTAAASGSSAIGWKERVAGCTGPADGFVYGGDPGKVLTFVRRGRGGDDRGGGAVAEGRALADVLRWFWKLKHDRGVLSYQVNEELETRREVGTKTGWEVVFTRNIGKSELLPSFFVHVLNNTCFACL